MTLSLLDNHPEPQKELQMYSHNIMLLSRVSVIVWVNVVLNRTVVGSVFYIKTVVYLHSDQSSTGGADELNGFLPINSKQSVPLLQYKKFPGLPSTVLSYKHEKVLALFSRA